MAGRFRLRIKSLKFISAVDVPAQEHAKVVLIKRAGADEVHVTANARVLKISDGADPLVYAWALMTHGPDGTAYTDLQGDQIQEDYIAAAEQYLRDGAAVDAMHAEGDSGGGSRVAFAFPMGPDVAKAFFGDTVGSQIRTSGLMVAIRPSPDILAGFRSGTYTGLSIAGIGEREPVDALKRSPIATPPRRRARKNAVLTTVTDGHQHTLCPEDVLDDSRPRLRTGYSGAPKDEEEHAHDWAFDPKSGKITIALAGGHSHTVDTTVPENILDVARSAAAANVARAAATAKSAGRGTVNPLTVTYAPGRAVFVFDPIEKWLGELPSDAARVEIAKLNPAAPWAAAWIAKGIEMDKQAEIDKHATDFEKALAASEITFEKAGTIIKSLHDARDRATAEHDAYIVKAAAGRKLHPGQVMNRLIDERDPEYLALYEKYSQAHAKAADPTREIAAQRVKLLSGKIDEINTAMRDQTEAFALDHNIEPYQAQDRLLKISTKARDLYEQASRLAAQRDMALQQAVGAAQQVNATIAAEAAKAAEMAKRAPERAVDKALREHVERFAKARGIAAYSVAMCQALEEDSTARDLYALAQERHAS